MSRVDPRFLAKRTIPESMSPSNRSSGRRLSRT